MEDHKIDGRNMHVDLARQSHEDESPIELPNVTGTNLMKLNDDCLREVLTRVTRRDLNSLLELSITTKNSRLKLITKEIFQRKHAIYRPNKTGDTLAEVRRTITNFGPLISAFSTDGEFSDSDDSDAEFSEDDDEHAMKSLVRHCSGTLKSLTVLFYTFDDIKAQTMKGLISNLEKLVVDTCFFEGDAADLFAHCESLVTLRVFRTFHSSRNRANCGLILRHTFPKLEFFSGEPRSEELKDFTLRHRKLKTIKLSRTSIEQSALIPVIANNCSELKYLQINTDANRNFDNYETSVKAITTLRRLEALRILNDHNPLNFIQQLIHLESLKELTLNTVRGSSEILSAITQLKMLEKLNFTNCIGFDDLNPISELVRLKDLSLSLPGNGDFDLVYVIGRLTQLEKLNLRYVNFIIDDVIHSRIIALQSESGNRRPILRVKYRGLVHRYFKFNAHADIASTWSWFSKL